MIKITTFILGGFLLLSSGKLMAASPIQPVLAVLVDANGTETIDSVSAPERQKDFKKLPGAFSAGYTRKVHWLRFTLSRPSPEETSAIVEIHPVYIKDLRLYEPLDSSASPKYAVHQTGNALPFAAKEYPYRGFAIKVNFTDRQPRVFYLRLQSTTTSLATIREWPASQFTTGNLKEYGWIGLFFGVLLTIFIVNLLNWMWTSEALFKHYTLYAGMLIIYFFGVDGLAAQYVFPTQPYWVDKWVSLGTLLTMASAAPFFAKILEIDPIGARRWKWLYRALLWFPVAMAPTAFSGFYLEAAQCAMLLFMLTLIVGLFRSASLFIKRRALSTSFILLAHIIGVMAVLSATLTALGLLPGDFWLIYGLQIGILVEALMFNMAISVRIREVSVEKREALERVTVAEQRADSERTARNEQGRFMAMLTHELKTPMSVIRVALNSADLSGNSVRHAEQAIQDMNNVIDRCIQIDNLEQRKSPLRIESLDIQKSIRELAKATGQSHRLAVHCSAFVHIENDRQYVGIALANLLDNAIKYAEPDSIINIRLHEDMHGQRPGISVLFENAPGAAGMPAGDQVFKKYYRSAGAHAKTGSGLGLYLVQCMAELTGAQVRYLPDPQLVRFELWLPR